MSCRQSKNVTRSKSLPGKSLAMATSNFVLPSLRAARHESAPARLTPDENRTDETSISESLRHHDGRKSVPAADVGDDRAELELRRDAVQRRQPGADKIVMISNPEEASGRAEQTLRLVAPADAFARSKRGLDFRLVVQHDRHHVEGCLHDSTRLSGSANTIACSGGKVNLPVAGSYSRYPDAA